MKFTISRASGTDAVPPIPEARREIVTTWDFRGFHTPEEHDKRTPWATPWLERGTEHGTWAGGIKRRLDDREVWVVEFNTLEEVVALVQREGDIIFREGFDSFEVGPLAIIIYDDYIE